MKQIDFSKITTFVFDVDGVFTDGSLLITERGELLRTMNTRDGLALKYAFDQGYRIFIITGGNSVGVRKRFEKLGLTEIHMAIDKKLDTLKSLIKKYNLNTEETLYLGDDFNDAECLRYSGISCTPSDGEEAIKEIVDIVLSRSGGGACVREVIEMVLTSQGKWMSL